MPYTGPPSYGQGHPRWGFAPSVWRWTDDSRQPDRARPPIGELRTAAGFALATGLVSLVAAGGEAWRFSLMLRGRTEVLAGGPVVASDQLIAYSSWIAMVFALITAIIAVPALVQAHRAVTDHAGLTPTRSATQVWLRLVVPGWNAWGAGQILTEIEATLADRTSASGRPRTSALIRWWWLFWVLSAVVVVLAIVRTFFDGLQAIADTVQLHIAVDAIAGVVGVFSGLLLLRLVRLFRPRRPELGGWTVVRPEPSRTRLSVSEAAVARRHSGVLPVEPAELTSARLVRPVTVPAGAGEVMRADADDADSVPTDSATVDATTAGSDDAGSDDADADDAGSDDADADGAARSGADTPEMS